MKSCPECNRTYPDDTLAFCLVDGSVLSASYEPEQTQRIPPTRTTSPPATEVLSDSARESGAAPSLQSTIYAPSPPLYSLRRTDPQPNERKRSLAPWLIVGGAILLVGMLGLVMLALRFSPSANSSQGEPSPTSRSRTSASAESSGADQSKSACGRTVSAGIYDKWISAGGQTGKLGCPGANEADAGVSPQGTSGRWIWFARDDGAYLIEHKSGRYAGKVFEVSGCIFNLYSSMYGTSSWLGFPVGDEYESAPGVRQDFEGGYVLWASKTSVCKAYKN
jgi:hypothetical protein